jgi:hypothetical protein
MTRSNKDRIATRETPASSDDDWQEIWDSVEKAQKSWTITGPIYALLANWKAWILMLSIVAWLQGGELLELILDWAKKL